MYECGVATHPQSPRTRTILFQCGADEDPPQMFAGSVRINPRLEHDVQKFTNDLLTSPDYFPGHDRAITRFAPNDRNIEQAAKELFTRLQEVLPVEREKPSEWPPHPFLRLQMPQDHVLRIESEPPENRLNATRASLLQSYVTAADGYAPKIFGKVIFQPGWQFQTLVNAWTDQFPEAEPTWVEGLAQQVMKCAQGSFPEPRWELMRSLDQNDVTWYGPVVLSVRTIPVQRVMEFTVYFAKFEVDDVTNCIKAGVPKT